MSDNDRNVENLTDGNRTTAHRVRGNKNEKVRERECQEMNKEI